MSFDLQPHMNGELIELRPLKDKDWGELFAVASDPLIWEQHRYQKAEVESIRPSCGFSRSTTDGNQTQNDR